MEDSKMFKRIQKLCDERNTTVKQVERDLGWANGSLKKTSPSKSTYARIIQLSQFFGISAEALVEGCE